MAHYTGYFEVPHVSFQEWRDATIGNGYNVDYSFGEQCWDYVALLYWQYGRTLVTKAGGGGAQDCWIYSRNVNSQPPFTSLTGKENIKRGDILVFGNQFWGHISFADEDYNPNRPDYISSLGQNQYGDGSGDVVTLRDWNLSGLLGIFRNTEWESSPVPPTPTASKKKDKFPWAVALHHWSNFKH